MSKQYHFIVSYNEATKKFILDAEMLDDKFGTRLIYNNETESWERLTWNDLTDEKSDFRRLENTLDKAISSIKGQE